MKPLPALVIPNVIPLRPCLLEGPPEPAEVVFVDRMDLVRAESLTLFLVVMDYLTEHVLTQKDVDAKRYVYVFNHVLRIVGAGRDVTTITRSDSRAYAAARIAEGVSSATARREITLWQAAMNHAFKEERLDKRTQFQMPPASTPRDRYLTREEYARLLSAPKAPRLHRFLLLAYYTGARSRAIEELTWDRVNFAERTIDYRIAGVVYKNKRRAIVPIIDALLPRLQSMYERRKPGDQDYVIGLGPRGKPSTTYHAVKEVMRGIGIDERGICRHVARHTVASWLLQDKKPILDVAKYLGDTVATVEKTYAHITAAHLHSSVNTLH